MTEAARADTPTTALDPAGEVSQASAKTRQRFDLANFREQIYGEAAILTYTLLISRSGEAGVRVRSHNETRILIRKGGSWKVVHVHKSPTWKAPYESAG